MSSSVPLSLSSVSSPSAIQTASQPTSTAGGVLGRLGGVLWKVGKPLYQTDKVQKIVTQATNLAQKKAVQQLQAQATQKSNPFIDRLVDVLKRLKKKVEQANVFEEATDNNIPNDSANDALPLPIEFSEQERIEIKNLLDQFIKEPAKYLDNAREEDGELIQFTSDLQSTFTTLITALEKDEIDDCGEELNSAIQFLVHVQSRQMGWLISTVSAMITYGLNTISSPFTNPDKIAESEISHETEEAQRDLLKRIITPEEVEPIPTDFNAALDKKLNEVTDIAIKMVLTKLIFQNDSWQDAFHRIYREALQKHETANATLDAAFYKALEDEFFSDAKRGSLIDQARYWFHLNITKRLLGSYINEMMGRFKLDLMKFLRRSPEERINDVFNAILNPLKSHMSAYYTYNMSLAGQTVGGTIDEANQTYFNMLKIDGKSIDAILQYFAHIIIEKYAPTISWTKGIETTLNQVQERVHEITTWKAVHGLFSITKVSAVWASFLLTGVFEWAVNAGLKYKIKQELKNFAKVNFFKTGNTEEKTHSRYQHIINLFIKDKLSQFNANGTSSKHTPIKLRSSPSKQEEMQGVIDELFRNIPLSSATNSPAALNQYFHGGLTEEVKREASTFFISQFTPAVSLELLKGMEHFLYDDKSEEKPVGLLSEFVWYTVNKIAKTMTSEAPDIDQIGMNTTETEMQEQLRMAVKSVVKDGVKTALDPSKKYQDETDATLSDLRKQTDVFLTSVASINIDNFATKNEEWRKLEKTVIDMETQFRDTKINKIRSYGGSLLTLFKNNTVDLNSSMDELERVQLAKVQLDDQVQILQNIGEQIKLSTAKDKIFKLKILWGKNWISPAFKKEISGYIEYLESFQKTPSSPEVLRLYDDYSKNFMEKLESEQQRLRGLILGSSNLMLEKIHSLKTQLEHLKAWEKTINPLSITSDDVTNTAAKIIKSTNLPVEQYAVPAVMYGVLELLKFKKKSYHWNGVLSRIIHASTAMLRN